MRVAVFARNYYHFRRWCRQAGIRIKDCDYIANKQDLRGKRFAFGIKLSGWSKNPEYDPDLFHSYHHHIEHTIYADLPPEA